MFIIGPCEQFYNQQIVGKNVVHVTDLWPPELAHTIVAHIEHIFGVTLWCLYFRQKSKLRFRVTRLTWTHYILWLLIHNVMLISTTTNLFIIDNNNKS